MGPISYHVLLVAAVASSASDDCSVKPVPGPNSFSTSVPEQYRELFRMHNTYRCMAGSPMLSWDQSMQDSAQKWANNGIYEHNTDLGEVGENLALRMTPTAAVVRWYEEIEYTNPWGVSHDARSPNGQVLSHYNQVVWTAATKIGCGSGDSSQGNFLVCHYYKGGNWGEYTKHVRAPWRGVEECGGRRSELPSNAPSPPPRVACFANRSLVADAGGTLGNKVEGNLKECEKACTDNLNCKSFTRCEECASGCWLKDRVLSNEDAAAQTDTAEGGQQCSSYVQVFCRKKYQQRDLVADEGANIGGVEPFVSHENCKEICENTHGCKSFATCETGHSGCWMKKKVVTATEPAKTDPDASRTCSTWYEVSECTAYTIDKKNYGLVSRGSPVGCSFGPAFVAVASVLSFVTATTAQGQ
eukprot:CAMPEP_0172675354 /NCGR_PEP_ID=MMETSP1074-20121228/13218_1 /TAXON_ID=2916 /ORGANISM="Ceratium fusus, Strain PA161109" /LENGTH=413 /DNA_ID=CAMNT_0013492809 /DNA_START=34 /DNA_END=1275 /DNA_ORIENTATION=+